jgi:SAM-dependent methyltransferase
MKRILEPELMDNEAEARAYAEADFSAANRAFIERFGRLFPGHHERLIDLGCGPGDVTIDFARARPQTWVLGVEAAPAMLRLAHENLQRARALEASQNLNVEFLLARLPSQDLPPGAFDAIVSNSLLHHLPDPMVLWREIQRIGKPGAAVLVGDLFRPPSEREAEAIVQASGASEDPLLCRDFFNSLCAAFEVEEVRAQIAASGLSLSVEQSSERHLMVYGRLP